MGGLGRWLYQLVRSCTRGELGWGEVLWNFRGLKLFHYEQVGLGGEV